jgi:hypothetical protein
MHNPNEEMRVIPTDSIVMKVDKAAVLRSGMMIPGGTIPDYMDHLAERQTGTLQERTHDVGDA